MGLRERRGGRGERGKRRPARAREKEKAKSEREALPPSLSLSLPPDLPVARRGCPKQLAAMEPAFHELERCWRGDAPRSLGDAPRSRA